MANALFTYDVVIVGAGLAGLSAALHLHNEGTVKVCVLEADDAVGGLIRTDRHEGFLLDRGFQVFLTAYPKAQRVLDYNLLNLRHFSPGALVNKKGLHLLADPFRTPFSALRTVFSPVASLRDKLKIVALRNRHQRYTLAQLLALPEQSTADFLRDWHFSPNMIEFFFDHFSGGVFLENELQTSSRFFEWVMKLFGEGYAACPPKECKPESRTIARPSAHSPVCKRG